MSSFSREFLAEDKSSDFENDSQTISKSLRASTIFSIFCLSTSYQKFLQQFWKQSGNIVRVEVLKFLQIALEVFEKKSSNFRSDICSSSASKFFNLLSKFIPPEILINSGERLKTKNIMLAYLESKFYKKQLPFERTPSKKFLKIACNRT